MNKATDALVSEEDFKDVTDLKQRGQFQRLVWELCSREPEIAVGLAYEFERTLRLLEAGRFTPQQLETLHKHLVVLAWSPAIVLDRVHRRGWEEFLPQSDDGDDELEGRDS